MKKLQGLLGATFFFKWLLCNIFLWYSKIFVDVYLENRNIYPGSPIKFCVFVPTHPLVHKDKISLTAKDKDLTYREAEHQIPSKKVKVLTCKGRALIVGGRNTSGSQYLKDRHKIIISKCHQSPNVNSGAFRSSSILWPQKPIKPFFKCCKGVINHFQVFNWCQ